MRDAGATAASKLKVFISYSRRDLAFADQLVAVLEWQGFLPIIDLEGIHGAERWKQRLGQMILEADIVVFVLSPDSAASEICAWEVEEAMRRGKRIVPVVCRPLEGQQPHAGLRDLNYIHFYPDKDVPGSAFGTGQVRLVEALSVDIGWLREHTRLEELAQRWDSDRRPADQLLRGSELSAYKAWRDRRPSNAPELTVLQRAFLGATDEEEASRAGAERKRLDERERLVREAEAAQQERNAASRRVMQRTLAGLVTAVLLAVVAGGFGLYALQQRSEADAQRRSPRPASRKQKPRPPERAPPATRPSSISHAFWPRRRCRRSSRAMRQQGFCSLSRQCPTRRRTMTCQDPPPLATCRGSLVFWRQCSA